MFKDVGEAMALAKDSPEVRARLTDLALYCRYVDLYTRYAHAQGEARQTAFALGIGHHNRGENALGGGVCNFGIFTVVDCQNQRSRSFGFCSGGLKIEDRLNTWLY